MIAARLSSNRRAIRSLGAIGLAILIGALTVAAPGLSFAALWFGCAILAILLGLLAGPFAIEGLVLAVLPATVLTGSALVPFEGRYVPAAATLIALAVAARQLLPGGVARLRARPALAAPLLAYGAWALVTTAFSSDRSLSATYVAGLALSLGMCAVILPGWWTPRRVERMIVVVAAIGVAIVVSGWFLLAMRGVVLFGKDLGVYFIEELALFGQRTGVTFHQNYGPFLGPSTEPLAFATVASLYLASRTTGIRRAASYAAAVVVMVGLVVTFSREGLLMAALATAALVAHDLGHRRLFVPAVAVSGFLAAVALTSLIGVVGVFGRLDLVAQWYGPVAVQVLMNPDHTERGEVPIPSVELVPGGATVPGPTAATVPGPTAATVPVPTAATVPVPSATQAYPDVVDLKTASSLDARFSLWSAAVAATAASPVVGYGLGTDADAIIPYLTGEDARLRGVTTHSTFMRILVEMGIPGLLIQIWLSLVAAAVAIRAVFRRHFRAAAVLAGCLAAILFHEVFGTLIFGGFGYTNFLFAALTSILAFGDLGEGGNPVSSAPRTQRSLG